MTIHQLIFSIIAASVSLGSILIAIGVLKGKINQNTETNKTQDEQIKTLATKDDLAKAIKRSDEMLELITKRAEEDRAKGTGQWREFHDAIAKHSERIGILENKHESLMKSLDEIKNDIKSGFRQLQDDLKELRKTL
jgi:predicted  nucleic acid-binding Zn-ribbon protein